MNKKIPTLKTIEKEFDEKFTYHDDVFDEHTNIVGRKAETEISVLTPAWKAEEIKSFFRQQIEEILDYLEMEELKEGKHDGHNNDDRCWCYQCQEVGEEEDFTDNHRYNQAVRELNAKIEKIRRR